MVKRSGDSSETLPPPNNAFARWISIVVTSSWALGVQTFPDPYNKYSSVFAPGVGYIAGYTLQYSIESANSLADWVRRKRSLVNINKSMANLRKELDDPNLDEKTRALINDFLNQAREKKLRIIAHPILPV